MIEFTASKRSFEGVSVETAARLIASACDIALILDAKAVIRDVSAANADLLDQLGAGPRWIGKNWADIVAPDGRAKVAALLKEAGSKPEPKWRHVNYPARKGGPDIPVQHAAAVLPDSGRTIVFGRDLRALSGLQHRLADAQFALERDLDRVRQSEARYRLLFQTAREPMLILEGSTVRVADANPAAQAAFKQALARHGARAAAELFAPSSRKALDEAIVRARATGREEVLEADSADGKTPFGLTLVAANRAADAPVFLRVTRRPQSAEPAGASVLVDAGPDGLVVSDADGKILHANRAFVEMTQIARADAAIGEPIDRWVGREGVDLDVLRASLRQRGVARHFATVVRGERGATREVEINAASRGEGKDIRYVFAVRAVDGKIAPARADAPRGAGRSPEQLAELIGRISLRELVRESTDAIERMCIEAALELTGDNRASAAEMLGLSRQSLYVKLRRYGLAELGEADND